MCARNTIWPWNGRDLQWGSPSRPGVLGQARMSSRTPAAPEAVPDGEDLVLLHQVEGAHLRGATASRHAVNSCGHVIAMRCKPLA